MLLHCPVKVRRIIKVGNDAFRVELAASERVGETCIFTVDGKQKLEFEQGKQMEIVINTAPDTRG